MIEILYESVEIPFWILFTMGLLSGNALGSFVWWVRERLFSK